MNLDCGHPEACDPSRADPGPAAQHFCGWCADLAFAAERLASAEGEMAYYAEVAAGDRGQTIQAWRDRGAAMADAERLSAAAAERGHREGWADCAIRYGSPLSMDDWRIAWAKSEARTDGT